MIKAVSFDFWNTFGIPNPEYAEARTQFLADYGITKEHYKNVKKFLDFRAEVDGVASNPLMALSFLFMEHPNVSVKMVYEQLSKLFVEHPPKFSKEIIESLKILKQKHIAWGITSNTNFIGGRIIRHAIWEELSHHNVEYPSICVFSDEIRYSKPSEEIFNKFYLEMDSCDLVNEIVHIGDHPVCDYEGAIEFGFQAKLIETQQDILTFVKEINND